MFLSGYFSGDTFDKFIALGYKGYALNYSFYDGRIIMGLICIVADAINMNIRALYIILLIAAIIISDKTVMKIVEIIENKKEAKGKLQYAVLVIIAYLYIFNFMTIDNMRFAECFIMALSVYFYILSAENMIIKHNWKKSLLYCIIGVFSYQGTINILFITTVLFLLIEKSPFNRKKVKDLLIFTAIIAISVLLNYIFTKIMSNYINTVQTNRLSLGIFENIKSNFKKILYLIFNTLDLFPFGAYITFSIMTLLIAYIYAIRKKQINIFILTIILFLMSIISSLLLLFVYKNGIYIGNGRIFGSIGASVSVMWIYLYVDTSILDTKNIMKYISIVLLLAYFILNVYSIINITYLYKEGNLIDEQLAKKIEQEIIDYEKNGDDKIEYIAINYLDTNELDNKSSLLRSMKLMGLFSEEVLKVYTKVNPNIEKIYFEEEIKEKYFSENIEKILCIGNTVYVQI